MLVKGNHLLTKDIKNILLIQLGDIGDVVLTFPCVRALRENFPQANIILAVREKAGELIEECPWANGVISINQDKRRLAAEIAHQTDFFVRLRRYKFDLVLDLRAGTRGAVLAFLCGARQRIGFHSTKETPWRNRVFTHLALSVEKPGQHRSEYYLSLLAAYNIHSDHIWPEFDIPFEKQQKAAALLRGEGVPLDRPVVALQPFSLWRYKEWGMEKYIQLIKRITSEYYLPVIIIGAAGERERAAEIAKRCGDDVHNFAGKTSVGTLAAVLEICRLFIGIDSAGAHISAAVGTPTVTIFGPGSSVTWAPRGNQHRIVSKKFPCVPCEEKGCQGSDFSRCLEELSVEEVMPVVRSQIDMIIGN